MSGTIQAWALLVAAAISNGVGALLIKQSQSVPAGIMVFNLNVSPLFLAGASLFALNLAVFTLALRTLPVSVAYPAFVGISQVVLLTSAALILLERLSTLQYFGVALTVTGILVMTFTTQN
jgi:multidrug transporter EmrE-like cation transporter